MHDLNNQTEPAARGAPAIRPSELLYYRRCQSLERIIAISLHAKRWYDINQESTAVQMLAMRLVTHGPLSCCCWRRFMLLLAAAVAASCCCSKYQRAGRQTKAIGTTSMILHLHCTMMFTCAWMGSAGWCCARGHQRTTHTRAQSPTPATTASLQTSFYNRCTYTRPHKLGGLYMTPKARPL